MILRSWTGRIRTSDRAAYAEYVAETGIRAYAATPGNLGAWLVMRDLDDAVTEVRTLSLWPSMAAIEAFAGDDVATAVFYPRDEEFLIRRDLFAEHFEVVD